MTRTRHRIAARGDGLPVPAWPPAAHANDQRGGVGVCALQLRTNGAKRLKEGEGGRGRLDSPRGRLACLPLVVTAPLPLRDWLLHYRRGGFDALYPKTRADRGRPRRLPAEVAELLLSIKADHPSWSVRQVIAGAVASGHLPDGVRPAHSTVHRLLRAEGLMSKPTATSDGTDRRRFSYRSAGQLWMSDVMHGPTVGDGTRRRKSYLTSFLDDAMVAGRTDRPANPGAADRAR